MTNKAQRGIGVSKAIAKARKNIKSIHDQIQRLDPAQDAATIEKARGEAYKLTDMIAEATDRRTALHRKFCDNVRSRREALGLTQAQVAKRLGLTQSYYSAIEHGYRTPGLDVIERVSAALNCEPFELLQ